MGMITLYVDLDDTLLHTRDWLIEQMYVMTGYRHKGNGFITPENTEGNITPVLDSAEFMRNTPPNIEMTNVLKQISDRVRIKICTHRGYHPKGVEYTEELLDRLQLDYIAGVEYLCSYKQPDKIEHLRSLGESFILLDDNPKFSKSKALEDTGEIMVFTQVWNEQLVISNHLRVNSPLELIPKLEMNPLFQKRLNNVQYPI